MNSGDAFNALKQFQDTRKGASDYYTDTQNELGVGNVKARADDLRGIIRNTETALKGVNASVGGRTRGQLVTEAQRARLENLERQPLMEGVASQQGQLSDEMQSYRDLLSQAGTKSGLLYQTDTDKASALQQSYQNIMAQEAAAREEAARKEAERQWWANFNAEESRFNRQLAETQRSSAATQAAMARLNSGDGYTVPSSPSVNPAIAQKAKALSLSKQGDKLAAAAKNTRPDYSIGGILGGLGTGLSSGFQSGVKNLAGLFR